MFCWLYSEFNSTTYPLLGKLSGCDLSCGHQGAEGVPVGPRHLMNLPPVDTTIDLRRFTTTTDSILKSALKCKAGMYEFYTFIKGFSTF